MTVPKRFGVLRFIAALFKVLAWIVLILAVLGGIAVALSSFGTFMQTPSMVDIPIIGPLLNVFGSGAGALLTGIGAALGGLLLFVVYFAIGESISMQLAVEENTRLTAALLLRMHQESQPDPRTAGGYAPYASEPFEG
jgi:drug/metabolite transporter (DMT)-like permease